MAGQRIGPHMGIMIRFLPLLLAALYGLAVYHFSARRTRAELRARSAELADRSLEPVLKRLAAALDLPRVRVMLYDIDPVNGLAGPDGTIYITRGFLERYRQGVIGAEELAGVIAHELGHVALGHTRRRMIDFSGQNAARTALAMVFARLLPGVGPWIANGMMTLIAARISRGDEFAADEYAAALMVKAGYGVGPLVSLFEKLDDLTGGGSSAPAWLLSHPPAQDRIAAINRHALKWGAS